MKEVYTKLSEDPPITLLDPASLTPERLDATYYAPKYLEDSNRIEESKYEVKSLLSISEKLNCGATPKQVVYSESGTPLIRTSNVRPNLYDDADVLLTEDLAIERDSNVAVLPGDVLYTMSGSVGYSAVYPENGSLASCSNTIARARVSDGDPYFVALFLNSSLGTSQTDRLVSGGVLAHVMPNPVKRLRVICPDFTVQKAMGNKLRKAERLRNTAFLLDDQNEFQIQGLFGHLPKSEDFDGRAWITDSSDLGRRLDAEYYLPRYTGILTALQSSVPTALLSDIEEGGGYGILPSSSDYGDGDLPLVRGTDLTGGPLHAIPESAPRVPQHYGNSKRAVLRPNEVMLLIKGATIDAPKSVGIVPDNWDSKAIVNGSIYKFRVKQPHDPYYLCVVLGAEIGLMQKRRAIANTGISYNDQESIREFLIPLPSPEIQKAIGDRLRESSNLKSTAGQLVAGATADIERLIKGSLDESALLAESAQIEKWLKDNPAPNS